MVGLRDCTETLHNRPCRPMMAVSYHKVRLFLFRPSEKERKTGVGNGYFSWVMDKGS